MFFSESSLLNFQQRLKSLRTFSIGFLICLLVPLSVMSYMGFQQYENILLDDYQREAQNLVTITNRKLFRKLTLTNTLPADAFDYYQEVYNPLTKEPGKVLSPLAKLHSENGIQGLVGYFQYNQQGGFNSPVWPYEIADTNAAEDAVETEAELVLRKNQTLNLYQIVSQSVEIQEMVNEGFAQQKSLFNVIFDLPEYFIFYRVVSLRDEPRLQGYVVERSAYLRQQIIDIIELRHFDTPVLIAVQDNKFGGETEYFYYQNTSQGELNVTRPEQLLPRMQVLPIYHSSLQWPYRAYEISVTSDSLPVTTAIIASGVFILVSIAAILFACYGFYRLGVKQLMLAEQRMNFVSSVSHELKTPLTSIRMYAEMLKSGTLMSAEYQQDYYEFIFSESERLTRLINNILQLSKLSQHQQDVNPDFTRLTVLKDIIRSKTLSIIDKHEFEQNIVIEAADAENTLVYLDQDAFSQVVINITDNAVKFFDKEKIQDPSRRKIDYILRCDPENKGCIQLEIRDYGVGLNKEQEGRIFELFYRGGNELTRTTQGTGIGLALVYQLVNAQRGSIQVQRRNPGLSLLVSFKSKKSDAE